MALLERERTHAGGQSVDVSLYESVFRLLEAVVPAYGKNGVVRERHGQSHRAVLADRQLPDRRRSVHGPQRLNRARLARA